jgi:bacterioferritin
MNEKVIGLLNDARSRELQAITQYMIQHYEWDDTGYSKLAASIKRIAIQEMKHAEHLAERILFLGGTPSTKPSDTANKGLGIAEHLKVDIALEAGAVKMYNDSARVCAEELDNISKALFEELLADEEPHLDEFQRTLDHVEKLGDAYVATLVD